MTAHLSNFLHPILELYNNGKIVKTKHIAEHFTTTFKLENEHKKPLKDFKFLHYASIEWFAVEDSLSPCRHKM